MRAACTAAVHLVRGSIRSSRWPARCRSRRRGASDVQQNGTALRQRHLGELVSQLAAAAGSLVRQEVELAKLELRMRVEEIGDDLANTAGIARAETREKSAVARSDLTEKANAVASGAGMFGAAGAASVIALGALTACVILLLNRSLPADAAAGVVAAAWALIAAALVL